MKPFPKINIMSKLFELLEQVAKHGSEKNELLDNCEVYVYSTGQMEILHGNKKIVSGSGEAEIIAKLSDWLLKAGKLQNEFNR